MQGNKAGVGIVIIVAVVVALSFSYVLTSPTGGSKITIPSNPAYTNTTNLWADAAGWNYGHGTINPSLNYSVGTVVTFHVTEEDTAPHTLYIVSAPSSPTQGPISYENQGNGYQILSTSQITQTKGHTVDGQYYFNKAGVYVYWCTIHPQTMVGWLYVNATSSSSTTSLSAAHSASGTGISNSHMTPPGFFASLSIAGNLGTKALSNLEGTFSLENIPSNINSDLQYPTYLDMSTVSGTTGGSVEL